MNNYVHNIPTIAKVLTIQDVIDVSIMKTVVSVGLFVQFSFALMTVVPYHCTPYSQTPLKVGSTLLVQMLNRLGVCASADTISRFIQFKMSNCNTSLRKYLQPDTFTDSIDLVMQECFVGVVGMSDQLSRQYNRYHPYPLQKAICDISIDMAFICEEQESACDC